MTSTLCPRDRQARPRPVTTSPSPPTLAYGAISAAFGKHASSVWQQRARRAAAAESGAEAPGVKDPVIGKRNATLGWGLRTGDVYYMEGTRVSRHRPGPAACRRRQRQRRGARRPLPEVPLLWAGPPDALLQLLRKSFDRLSGCCCGVRCARLSTRLQRERLCFAITALQVGQGGSQRLVLGT